MYGSKAVMGARENSTSKHYFSPGSSADKFAFSDFDSSAENVAEKNSVSGACLVDPQISVPTASCQHCTQSSHSQNQLQNGVLVEVG